MLAFATWDSQRKEKSCSAQTESQMQPPSLQDLNVSRTIEQEVLGQKLALNSSANDQTNLVIDECT